MTVAKKYLDQTFTLAEYLALPENDRMELIEGVPYALASPSTRHQEYAGAFYAELRTALRGKRCQAFIAPLDVFLNESDERRPTVVQPDVFVVCDPDKISDRGCHGAPDLIIEILSPGSRSHDQLVKLNLYRRCGVREYWIVDPTDPATVMQYTLDDQGYRLYGAYGAEDEIPVQALPGLTLSLKDIFS